ncbi:MAG TPA: mandelate racemase/muconate lactonizing enzyme family protein [Candidatus Baltobacteraceae bacterium]|nr:mandelate racemase/muconate lactonizing enzyme family protein [Candidatus Baltobacteraceae bacterium]
MKIRDAKTYVVANPPPHHGGPYFVFIKLTTDENVHGFGEVYGAPFAPDRLPTLIADVIERHVLGANPFQTEALWRIIYSRGYAQHPDLTLAAILSGIEIACWDIVGKALNQPIYNLLGGQVHEKLRSYTYLYAPKPATTDTLASTNVFGDAELAPQRAAAYVKQGFTAVKFDPIMPMSAFDPRQLSLAALDNAELVVKNVREAVGSACDLLIGTHGQMTAAAAIRLAKRLEPYDPLWLEEPVPPEHAAEMATVARATSIPVATGERLATKYDFVPVLQHQAAAILQPALARVGGIIEAKKIAGMAEAHHVQIAPHLYCGPIEAAANIQIATCSPNFLIQESIETFGGFYADLVTHPIQWQDGYIIPPTRPGLGIELNEAVAAAHPYQGPVFPEMVEHPVWA